MKKIILINGPNLNLLGLRESIFYGNDSLKDVETRLRKTAEEHGYSLECFQSNHEGNIIDFIHGLSLARHDAPATTLTGVIINAGGLTHTSIALRDALATMAPIPFIEVHISNIFNREAFRHESYLSDIAAGVIVGFGTKGYDLALSYFLDS